MDGQRLLQLIGEVPGDDLPRIVYADWLEENGGAAERARAGLIRLQVKNQGIPRERWSQAEIAQERQLLSEMMPALDGWRMREGEYGWGGSRPGDTLEERLDVLAGNFDRGFLKPVVEGECHQVGTFLRAMGGLLKSEPFFNEIRINSEWLGDFERDDLLMTPHLENVRTLSFNAGDIYNIASEIAYSQRRLPIPPAGVEGQVPETSSLRNIRRLSVQMEIRPHVDTFSNQVGNITRMREHFPYLESVSAGSSTHTFLPSGQTEAASLSQGGAAAPAVQ